MAAPALLIAPVSTVRLTEHWHVAKDGDPAGLTLYERHYSCKTGSRGIAQFVGPGEKVVLLTQDCDALFVWRRFMENHESEPKGINCAVFRNESSHRASGLILEAERVAWCRWPGERLYTYVDPKSVRKSRTPGRCFLKAGWRYAVHEVEGRLACLRTLRGLIVLEKVAE